MTFLEAVHRYLECCFSQGTAPRADELARFLDVSRTTLNERFLAQIGQTPSTYLKRVQVDLAKTLLLETGDSVARVAERSGFSAERSFYRSLRRLDGVTPSDYRRNRSA